MKQEYEAPELQVVNIESGDVVKTSGGNEGPIITGQAL